MAEARKDQERRKKAQNEIMGAILEFSKKIAASILMLYALQMLAGIVAIIVDQSLAEPLTKYMETCKPVYIAGVLGYDAKAGVENALKISNAAKQLSSEKNSTGSG